MIQKTEMVNYWLAKQEPSGPRGYNFKQLKKEKKFKNWELIKISRLSIMPVPKQIWDAILKISQN